MRWSNVERNDLKSRKKNSSGILRGRGEIKLIIYGSGAICSRRNTVGSPDKKKRLHHFLKSNYQLRIISHCFRKPSNMLLSIFFRFFFIWRSSLANKLICNSVYKCNTNESPFSVQFRTNFWSTRSFFCDHGS